MLPAGVGAVSRGALGGELSVDAQRFGVEARFSRPDAKLRPEAALVAHGSTFGGNGKAIRLDERRLLGGTAMGAVAHASSDPRVLGVFGAARRASSACDGVGTTSSIS